MTLLAFAGGNYCSILRPKQYGDARRVADVTLALKRKLWALLGIVALFSASCILGAESRSHSPDRGAPASSPWPLEAIYRSQPGETKQLFATRRQFEFSKVP